MATRSLGSLTIDLIARVGGFVEGMGKAEREADRRAKAIERRLQKMGKVIDAALQVAAAAAVSAAGAIAVGMKNAIDRMDELAKSSQKIGIGTEALSKLAYAADLSGVEFGQLEGALAKLAKSQDMAAQGAKEQLDIFRALGVEFQRSDGTLRNVEDVFSDLADRFQALPDGANKTAAAMALLGRSGAQLIPLLNGGSDGLREMGDELERLGGVVTPEAARQAEEFNDNLSRLKVAASGLWITLATELLPYMVRFTEEMVDGAEDSGGLRDQVRDLAGVLRDMASFADIAADSIQALTLQVIGMGQAMSGVAKLNPFAAIGVWAMGGDSALQDFEDAANAWALIDDQFEKAPAFDIDESLRAGQALSDRAKRALGAADAERRLAEALEQQRSEEERARAAKEAAAAAARAAAMEERERLKALRELALAQESLNGVLRAQAEEMGGPLARAAFEYQDTMVRLAGVEEELVRLGKLDEEQQVKLALARQQANAQYQQTVELIQSQKDPLEELLESMQLEIDLLGMGNAERITELELLRLIDEYRRRGIELSQEEIDAARERIRSKVDEVDALREQISALDQFRDSFEDNVSAVLDGSKSIKDAIRDLVNDFIAQMLRMAAHNFTEALFGQMGTPGGGLFGSTLGGFFNWFGGPRAEGGPVSPGKAYLVGEQGPELFRPNTPGVIVPSGQSAAMTRSGDTFVIQGSTSRRSIERIRLEQERQRRRAAAEIG